MRNGFCIPKLKSTIVTEEYLTGVIEEKYWVPRFGQFAIFACTTPPTKQVLLQYLDKLS